VKLFFLTLNADSGHSHLKMELNGLIDHWSDRPHDPADDKI